MVLPLSTIRRADYYFKENIEDPKRMDLEWNMIKWAMLSLKELLGTINTMGGVAHHAIKESIEMVIMMDMVFTSMMRYITKGFSREDFTVGRGYASLERMLIKG